MDNDILDTRREKRLDEARRVFNDMQKLLTHILEEDETPHHLRIDLVDEINAVLDRAALVAF